MKFAIVLLSVMVALSQTQYLRRSRFRWSPPQQRVYDHYQPIPYDDYIEDYPSYRHYRPSRPIIGLPEVSYPIQIFVTNDKN